MLDYDPVKNLQQYPLSMARFGKNPFGENLWRIVWAPTRRILTGDSSGFRWVPAYRQIGSAWVLEKWVDSVTFSGCGPTKWNETLLILGPYPARGEYIHAHTFGVSIEDANLDKLIRWIEAGSQRSWQDNIDAVRGEYDAEEKAASETRRAIIYNALPAFGAAASSGFGGGKGTKHLPNLKTANELGLPLGQNKFVQMKGKSKNAAKRKTVSDHR